MGAGRDRAAAPPRAPLTGALAAALLSALLPAFAQATNYKVDLRTGARLEADVNQALDPGGEAGTVSGSFTAGATVTAETKRGEITADFSAAARARASGDGDLDGQIDLDPNLRLSGTLRGKTTTLNASGDFLLQRVDTSQVEDTGVIDRFARQLSGSAQFSATEDLDARTALVGSFSVRVVDFTENVASLTPSRTFSGAVSLRRSVTATTDMSARVSARRFLADDAEGERSDTLDLGIDVTHRRTSRHTFSAGAGVSFVRTVERNTGAPTETDIGFTGRLGLDYRLKDLTLGLNLTQDIEPSAVGALQTFTRFGFGLNYDLNTRESIAFTADASRRMGVAGAEGEGGTRDTFSLGPSYSLRLDEQTRLSLGYLFRLSRESDEGTATGHRVFLNVSRNFPLLD